MMLRGISLPLKSFSNKYLEVLKIIITFVSKR